MDSTKPVETPAQWYKRKADEAPNKKEAQKYLDARDSWVRIHGDD